MSLKTLYRQAEALVVSRRGQLDSVLVVDLEATTWADQPRNSIRDIIQIGVCHLDLASCSLRNADCIDVRPTSSKVTLFCTKLTRITPEQAALGLAFTEACLWLQKCHHSSNTVWASYGDFDRAQIAAQCAREGIPYPFGAGHLDIKLLAALRFGWKRPKGLPRALAALGMHMEGRHHFAQDDAVNAARILARVLRS